MRSFRSKVEEVLEAVFCVVVVVGCMFYEPFRIIAGYFGLVVLVLFFLIGWLVMRSENAESD